MKKIKNFYPLIVGVVLLVSVAAYGTRAYFSDSTEEQANIKLTLGNVEVKSESSEWKYEPNESASIYNDQLQIEGNEEITNTEELGESVSIKNVRPGDSFSKTFTITNNGTLDATVEINQDITSELPEAYKPYVVTLKLKNSSEAYEEYVGEDIPNAIPANVAVLLAGEKAELELVVSAPEAISDDYNRKINTNISEGILNEEVTLDLMNKFIKIKLNQAD